MTRGFLSSLATALWVPEEQVARPATYDLAAAGGVYGAGFPATIIGILPTAPDSAVWEVRALFAKADSAGGNLQPLALQRLYARRAPSPSAAPRGWQLSGALAPSPPMWFRGAAAIVLLVHLAFVLFVVFGGLLAFRWPRVVRFHVPIALYGALIEFVGFTCPLTPLEIWLRRQGGEAGYSGGFIEHYVTAALYPTGLTRAVQLGLGVAVLVLNGIVYAVWLRRRRRRRPAAPGRAG